jgi:hypothetical protein
VELEERKHMSTTTTTEKPSVEQTAVVKTIDFGNGRYSKAMGELFRDSRNYFGLSDKQAEKLARSFGADLGRLSTGEASVKIGRLRKDGFIPLREAASVKCVLTNSIAIAKLVSNLNDCLTYGLDYAKTEVALKEPMMEWLNS